MRPLVRSVATIGSLVLLAGCDLSDAPPTVQQQGPTAPATALPEVRVTEAPPGVLYDEAEGRIEAMLREEDGPPIDVLDGELRGSGEPVVVEVLSLRATDLSLVLHVRLRPGDGEPMPLADLDGGLSGELGEGNRSVADIALVDESTDLRILPTVYRPDVGEEDPGQRCMCSSLPEILPADGVRLTAHFVRPEKGFASLEIRVPGVDSSLPIAPAGSS